MKFNAASTAFRCPSNDTSFNRKTNFERQSIGCNGQVKQTYKKNVYQIRETLFDKLDSFAIECTNEQILFETLVLFDFDSVCAHEESYKDTDTTKWSRKNIPISVSFSPKLVRATNFTLEL